MLHPEWKQEYIRYRVAKGADSAEKKRISTLFRRISDAEVQADTDIAEMDAQSAAAVMKAPGVLSASIFYTSVCTLRDYASWCVMTERAHTEACALSVVPDGLDAVRETMVSGPEHLESALNIILSPVESGSAETLLRAYVWLVYAGVHPEDIQNLKSSDVDLDRLTVKAGRKEYRVCGYAAAALDFAVNGTSLRISHPQYSARPREESDFLMRGTKSVLTWNDCSSRIGRKCLEARREGRMNLALTNLSIGRSGMFYGIYHNELAGYTPDFTADIEEYMTYQTERRGKGYSVYGADATGIRRNLLLTSFLEDYSRWKLAFLPSMNKQHN